MNTERHLDDLTVVIGANMLGWLPTLFQWEELFRLLGLILACVYTSLKIWELLKDRRRK